MKEKKREKNNISIKRKKVCIKNEEEKVKNIYIKLYLNFLMK